MNIYDPVKSIMSNDSIVTIHCDEEISKIKEIFDRHSFHHIPVVEGEMIKGIVSKSDFLLFQRSATNKWGEKLEGYRLKNFKVSDIMADKIAVLEPKDSIATALKVFKENLFHALPIVEKGKLVGIVTTHDIVIKLLENDTVIM